MSVVSNLSTLFVSVVSNLSTLFGCLLLVIYVVCVSVVSNLSTLFACLILYHPLLLNRMEGDGRLFTESVSKYLL